MLVSETRRIIAVLKNGQKHQVIAWDGETGAALILHNTQPYLTDIKPAEFLRFETTLETQKVITPVWVTGRAGPKVSCPHPSGRQGKRWEVDESKIWAIALKFGEPDVLSFRRWQSQSFTRSDIKAILLLFHRAGLCTEVRERKPTVWLPGITRDDIIAFVANVTSTPPPSGATIKKV